MPVTNTFHTHNPVKTIREDHPSQEILSEPKTPGNLHANPSYTEGKNEASSSNKEKQGKTFFEFSSRCLKLPR
jgi:hypothetical protein